MKLYANLHLHSTHSDGVYTPEELVAIGRKEGYRALALTDHDTISGWSDFQKACDAAGLECLLGAEFTTSCSTTHPHYKLDFHIVAFHFDPEYPPMKEYLEKRSLSETNQTKVCFERGVRIGAIAGVTWEDVLAYNAGISWLCNDHVFRTMKSKGVATDMDYPKFFRDVYGAHRAEVPDLYPFMQPDELLALIKAAGGIAICAHPADGRLDCIDALAADGLDGLEVWHQMLTEDERKRALEIARAKKLYISGGSDHSGLMGGQYAFYAEPEKTQFWVEPCTLGTTKEYFEEIRDRRINR